MCTAITYKTEDFYFGRNLDLEYSYNEAVCITPRKYAFNFRNGETLKNHYAIIGVATVCEGYPLYYEATNEKGLSLAGLNFPDIAVYNVWLDDKLNLAPFELIPWILGRCVNVDEALFELNRVNLWSENFNSEFPLSPLHWLLSDKNASYTLEPMSDGLHIHLNPVGVLTNNPPFDYHMYNLVNYMNLTPLPPVNRFSASLDLKPYSLGMGGIGLPGDISSASRFVRAAYTKTNSFSSADEFESVSQFFHILDNVAQPRGLNCVRETEIEDENKSKFEYTLYSSCCNASKGIFYYKTYLNNQITAVSMHKEDIDGHDLALYPLINDEQIRFEN